MNDCILIRDLAIHAFHGVHEEESRLGQRFVLDITVYADLSRAACSDDYRETLCYDAIIREVTQLFTGQTFKLIEAAGQAVALMLLEKFAKATRVVVDLRKPFAPIAAQFSSVGIRIERER